MDTPFKCAFLLIQKYKPVVVICVVSESVSLCILYSIADVFVLLALPLLFVLFLGIIFSLLGKGGERAVVVVCILAEIVNDPF